MTTQALHRLTISVIEGKELSQKDRNGTSDPFVSVRILTVIPNSNAGAEVQTPSTGTNANVVDNTNNNNAGTEANGANPQKRKSNKVKLFKKSDSGKSSVRENIVLRGIRTHVIKKTLNPQWDEVFEIDIDLADNFMLVFTCWDKDLLINDFMGEVRIPARRLLSNPGQGIDEWFDLQSRQGRRDKVNGSLHLAISYVETTTQPETNNINVPANGAKPTSPRRNWALSPKMSRRFKSPIFSRDSERFRELIRQFSKLVADCLESGKLDPLEKQLNQYKKDNLDLKTFFSCDMWDNKSPLSEALRKNNKDAVKLLLKFNADPNRSLCDSAQAAEIDLARQLIDEYGANANCEFEGEETSMTPLAYCLTNSGLTTDQKVSITKLLLEKGADPLKRVAFHANAYQYVRKEVENEKDYTALISALKINGSDSFILPRYSFVGLDRPMPRSEPLLVTAGQKINLREFLPKNIEISPAEEDFKSVVVNAEYKENEIGIVELAFRLSDKSSPTVVRVLFHVFNKNRVAYFTDVWYEVDQGAEDQCENITVALGMNPYIYYSKKTTHVDDCQYTLAYVYWTRPTDDESAATEEKQKSDIEKAKNNKEEEKYQYTSFRYISAVGMSSIPPRPMKGRRYFSSELPRDEESQDLPRPLRYGAGQSVSKLEEDDKNNKSNTNTNSIVNSNTTSDVHTNTVVSPNNGRRSLSMSTPTKPGTPIAEITIPREGLSPRNEASELGGSVVFNDLFTCVATGTATQLKTMLDTKTYPIEELNQCLTKACLIFAPKKAALLLKVGAEPAYYDAADGVYPIHRAVQYASFANDVIIHKMGLNVRLFVSKGVDLSVKDKKGNGVMDYVPFKHKAKIESALKEKRGFDELYKSVLAEIEKDDKK